MKITVNRAGFIKSLKIVRKATKPASHEDRFFYDAVEIKAGLYEILLACAEPNQPKSIETMLNAEIDGEAVTFAVNLRNLLRLVGALHSETITMNIESSVKPLHIEGGEFSLTIPTIDPQNVFVSHVVSQICDTPVRGLLKAASRVWFSASTEEARPVLQAVQFNGRVAATDGFRIAVLPVSFEGVHALIPAAILRLAWKLFRGGDVLVKVSGIRFSISDGITTLHTNLIEGKFPDVDVIIPKKAKLVIELDAVELQRAMQVMLACQKANDDVPICHFEIIQDNHGDIQIAGTTKRGGEYAISVNLRGSLITQDPEFKFPFNIAVNAGFICDVAARIAGRVQIGFNASNTPIIMRPVTQDNELTAVVMPMRIG